MTSKAIFDEIGRFYDGLVERFGHHPRACDYGNPASQQKKFQVLSEVMDLSGRRVLDIGCGFGDFGVYLQQRYGDVRYSGLDLSEQMVDGARALHPQFRFRHGNLLDLPSAERFDVVTANGIFYLLGPEAEVIMRSLLSRMFEIATEAVAFNSLSSHAASKEEGEFYADPAKTVAYCQTLTPWVVLRHDYHPRDFTMYLYKETEG